MLRPRDGSGRNSSQRRAASRQFGKVAQMAAVVGIAEKIRRVGQLRGVLGWLNPGQRKQGYYAEMKRAHKGPVH